MQRFRTIAGPPYRTATAAWATLSKLISDTLTVSQAITSDAVTAALAPLQGIGPALIAAGHLESTPVVLVSGSLHLAITVRTGAAVASVEENLNPVPGGATATTDWMLYLPSPASFATALTAAVAGSSHLSIKRPPTDGDEQQPVSAAKAAMIDLTALQGLRASS